MPTSRRLRNKKEMDFYPTPSWATRALVENESFRGPIWEPACGDGAMVKELKKRNLVHGSDLHNHGYGDGVRSKADFLKATTMRHGCVNIATNPPYSCADEFVLHALKLCPRKVVFLLRLSFLEGIWRQRNLFKHYPPARLWIFSERITFYRKGAKRKGSGTLAYAWFIWEKNHQGPTEIKWLPIGYKPRRK